MSIVITDQLLRCENQFRRVTSRRGWYGMKRSWRLKLVRCDFLSLQWLTPITCSHSDTSCYLTSRQWYVRKRVMVWEKISERRDELFRVIMNATRRINEPEILGRITYSTVKWGDSIEHIMQATVQCKRVYWHRLVTCNSCLNCKYSELRNHQESDICSHNVWLGTTSSGGWYEVMNHARYKPSG
jgi:hypothetical protein